MSSHNQPKPQPLYPKVLDSNPDINSAFLSNPNPNPNPNSEKSSFDQPSHSISDPNPKPSSLYPSIDMKDLANLFHDSDSNAPNLPPPVEEIFLRIPGAILHLIDRNQSVELASGEFIIVRLVQGQSIVAVLARVGDNEVQWPLARDEASVKLDESHYFFSLHVPKTETIEEDESEGVLSYGLTFASKGQEDLLRTLDGVLEAYSSFSVQEVESKVPFVGKDVTPAEAMSVGPKREMMEKGSEAYWTTLAPNVEEYSSSVAKAIARGSGQLIRGILWCGDVTVDRLKWGEELMKRRTSPCAQPAEISRDALKRMKRVKAITKMSDKVVSGVLNGVVKVSGFVTGSIINSTVGKKFFGLVPGEIALATLDGFGKVSDAVEVVGRNVLQTSSVVTTGVVSHRYGEQAADVTHEGLGAAGHALGTALAVFKIRKALNPKNSVKPKTLAKSFVKSAAADIKANKATKKMT